MESLAPGSCRIPEQLPASTVQSFVLRVIPTHCPERCHLQRHPLEDPRSRDQVVSRPTSFRASPCRRPGRHPQAQITAEHVTFAGQSNITDGPVSDRRHEQGRSVKVGRQAARRRRLDGPGHWRTDTGCGAGPAGSCVLLLLACWPPSEETRRHRFTEGRQKRSRSQSKPVVVVTAVGEIVVVRPAKAGVASRGFVGPLFVAGEISTEALEPFLHRGLRRLAHRSRH